MKIVKSFRKTLTLKVDRDGELIIKAPHFTTQRTIDNFIEKHRDWIIKRQNEIKSTKKTFNDGDKLFFLGEEYSIVYSDKIKKIKIEGGDILIPGSFKRSVKSKLTDFYKKEARPYIEERLLYICRANEIDFNNFRITSAKTRWGSCSSKKNLNFTFRLIMAPKDVIDYVVVHELSHLKEMNHSKRFWAEVEKMSNKIGLENYKSKRKWLKDNGNKISYV